MPSVRLDNVSFRYTSAADIIRAASIDLGPGWTGVVGANGMGKSTLLRLIGGELDPTSGSVTLDPNLMPTFCPQEVGAIGEAVHSLAAAYDGASRRMVGELRLEADELDRWSTLSPGERKRWQIGAALAAEPSVLLLDEPTNHLDSVARETLSSALRRFRGVGLVVSHDRAFLNDLTSKTVRVDYGNVELWNGNYETARVAWELAASEVGTAFEKVKSEQRKLQRRAADQRRAAETKRARHKRSIRQAGSKDSDARSMEKKGRAQAGEAAGARQLEVTAAAADRAAAELATFEMRRAIGRSFFFDYEPARRQRLLSYSGDLTVADRLLVSGVDVTLARDQRVWLRGPNGAGKTTLLRAMADASTLSPRRMMYLPQELTSEDAAGLLDELRSQPSSARGLVLNLVAALGVDPDRLLVTDAPSPGEARKLAMALGMGRSAWCLLLDEPTNHLDLPSIERLEEALAAYPGAVLLVTHDDEFATATTTMSWRLADGMLATDR